MITITPTSTLTGLEAATVLSVNSATGAVCVHENDEEEENMVENSGTIVNSIVLLPVIPDKISGMVSTTIIDHVSCFDEVKQIRAKYVPEILFPIPADIINKIIDAGICPGSHKVYGISPISRR